jgi:hypothetical protein
MQTIDWKTRPSVVFESDDWGSCEFASSRADYELFLGREPGNVWRSARLETPKDLKRLYSLLEQYRDKNARAAVFTAFFCMANPNYDAIRASGFQEYHDIPIDAGMPSPWTHDGLVKAWRDGVRRGVLAPEFHGRLHHTQPSLWLKLLQDGDAEAAWRFAHSIFIQNEHLPEYEGLSDEETREWVRPAVGTFTRLFSACPTAAVSSDATPLTEKVWAELGMKTFCLRNFSIPGAPPIVYSNKPWNNQDPDTPMGARNPGTGVTYLSRNIFFEPAVDGQYSFSRTISHLEQVWQRNEPAVISTHRVNYLNWNCEVEEFAWRELERLLAYLSSRGDVHFHTSAEIARIFHSVEGLNS